MTDAITAVAIAENASQYNAHRAIQGLREVGTRSTSTEATVVWVMVTDRAIVHSGRSGG